jgi:hypothetical protein
MEDAADVGPETHHHICEYLCWLGLPACLQQSGETFKTRGVNSGAKSSNVSTVDVSFSTVWYRYNFYSGNEIECVGMTEYRDRLLY